MIRKLGFIIVTLAITGTFVTVLQAADKGGNVEGIVKNRSGEPVIGAFVRVKNADRRLSVTVISRERGRYNAPELLPGKYTVQSVGGGLQSEEATAEIDGNHGATVNLVLTAPINFKGNVPIAEMATLMPEGEAKPIILGDCTHCHLNGVEEIVLLRKNREGWDEIIKKTTLTALAIPSSSSRRKGKRSSIIWHGTSHRMCRHSIRANYPRYG